MHIYWLVACFCGLTAAVIAHGKGRSAVGWFLCGLVIGPFALIVGLLPPAVREGRYVRCPACQEVILESASLCRYCHTAIADEEVDHGAPI